MHDPIEGIVGSALSVRGVRYVCDGDGDTKALDFYLPDFGVYIEVKQFHTERVSEQMTRDPNIIVIQGRAAAEAFASLITT